MDEYVAELEATEWLHLQMLVMAWRRYRDAGGELGPREFDAALRADVKEEEYGTISLSDLKKELGLADDHAPGRRG